MSTDALTDEPTAPIDDSGALQQQYPAVPLAFEFVRPSYEFAARRTEAVEGRLRAFLTLAATVAFAAPAYAAATVGKRDALAPPFVAAMVAFFVVLLVAVLATRASRFRTYDPGDLYRTTLHLGDWEFKRALLFRAGEHFDANIRHAHRLARVADLAGLLVLLELVLFALWLYGR